MTTTYVAQCLEDVAPFVAAWDRLAEEQGCPLARPAWLLPWWRAMHEEQLARGELRIVVVCDDDGLAGVAPLFVEDVHAKVVNVRFLGQATLVGVHPLVRSDRARDTLAALARAIASLEPRPSILSFDAIDVDSPWPQALVGCWPGRGAWLRDGRHSRATAVRLDGTFEDWVQTRRSDWRSGYRRRQRRLAEQGGVVRRAESVLDAQRGVGALVRLHRARWSRPSDQLSPAIDRTLRDAGERLVASNGFRLWTVEIDDEIIGATVFAAAGGTVAALCTAYDSRWGRFAPGQGSMVAGIAEGFRLGDDIVDLSFGEYRYKFQLATETRSIAWHEVFPRDRRYPLTRAQALPRHVRERLNEGRVRLRPRARLAQARSRIAGWPKRTARS